MTGRYFIVIYCGENDAHAMTDDNEDFVLYPSLETARAAVQHNLYAQACGYEIFRLGEGET